MYRDQKDDIYVDYDVDLFSIQAAQALQLIYVVPYHMLSHVLMNVFKCFHIYPTYLYTFHMYVFSHVLYVFGCNFRNSRNYSKMIRVFLILGHALLHPGLGMSSFFVRSACNPRNTHNFRSIPTSLDLVDEKMTCVGSWETACVDRNWAGGEGGDWAC